MFMYLCVFILFDTVCFDHLGMKDGSINDEQLTASSSWYHYTPDEGRLDNLYYHWESDYYGNDRNPWIQIDLGYSTKISGIITQGGQFEWVTTLKVSYYREGSDQEIFITDESRSPKVCTV